MNSNPTSSSSLSTQDAPEAISRRAYELWEQEGRPEGRDLQHWLQAEQELRGGSTPQNGHDESKPGNGNGGSARYDELGTARPTTDTRPLSTSRTSPAATKRTAPPATERAGSSTPGVGTMSPRRK